MNRTVSIFIIILTSLLLIIFEQHNVRYYKVLEVVEGDKFYIDLNNDGKKDKDELFHIKNVNTFPLKYGEKAREYAKRYDLEPDECLYLGKKAKKYAIEHLLGKEIRFIGEIQPYNSKYYYRFAEILTKDGKNFGVALLEEGLAFAYEGKSGGRKFNPYKTFENLKTVKKNAALCGDFCSKKSKPEVEKSVENRHFEQNKIAKTPVFKESLARTFNDVTIFLINPNAFNRPSNSCKTLACRTILDTINHAQSSIDFALYGFEGQDDILEALINAKNRGVLIRGVVDSKADNTYVYRDTTKLISNFQVISDLRAPFMHNKFFIFDKKTVITGTMNISASGSGGYNANTMVLIKNPAAADVFTQEFNDMYSGKFQAMKGNNTSKNICVNSKDTLDIYFSPVGNTLSDGILPVLTRAEHEILVSIFYLTNKEIIDALIDAKKRGVDVKIIYDAVGANSMKEKVRLLRANGIAVKVENWGGKAHEKNMTVDGKIFITGSANFSNSGIKKNDENLLIFKSPEIASFYRNYFLKLYNSIDEKYLKFTPRAESFESGNSCYDGIDNNFDGKTDSEDIGCKR